MLSDQAPLFSGSVFSLQMALASHVGGMGNFRTVHAGNRSFLRGGLFYLSCAPALREKLPFTDYRTPLAEAPVGLPFRLPSLKMTNGKVGLVGFRPSFPVFISGGHNSINCDPILQGKPFYGTVIRRPFQTSPAFPLLKFLIALKVRV